MISGFIRWLRNPRHFSLFLISLLPALGVFFLIYRYGGSQIPFYDQWFLGLDIAIKTKQNTLTLSDVFMRHAVHRHLWYNLWTVFLVQANDWNLKSEVFFPLIFGLIKYILLLLLIYKHYPHFLHKLIVPLSIFIFYLYQPEIWLLPFNVSWHLVLIGLLSALLVIAYIPPGWKALTLIILWTLFGTFSMGTGLLLWGILPVVLWLSGYRRWPYFALWSLIAVVVVLFYRSPWGGYTENYYTLFSAWEQIQFPDPIVTVLGLITSFGVPILGQFVMIVPLFIIGIIGILLVAANSVYIVRSTGKLESLALWVGFTAFSVTSMFLVIIGRAHLNFESIFSNRYVNHSVWLWISLICLIAINRNNLSLEKHPVWKWLSRINKYVYSLSIVMTLFVSILFFVSYNYLEHIGQRFWYYPQPQDEQCLREYILSRSCTVNEYPSDLSYQLALYRLSIFFQDQSINILPENAQPDAPIVIHSSSRWLNLYMRESLLMPFTEANLFHVAPVETLVSTTKFPRPLNRVVADLSPSNLSAIEQFIEESPEVWYLTTADVAQEHLAFFEMMEKNGYTRATIPIEDPYYRNSNFQLYRFEKQPTPTDLILRLPLP